MSNKNTHPLGALYFQHRNFMRFPELQKVRDPANGGKSIFKSLAVCILAHLPIIWLGWENKKGDL